MQTNGVPDTAIRSLLGKGWSYADWQRETTRLGFVWNEGLRLRIIRKEYQLFKTEIGLLLSQPNTNSSLKSRSNSYKSIIKRIKGKTGEREQRLREGTLFGSEARSHTLENYVKKWRTEDPSFGHAKRDSQTAVCDTPRQDGTLTMHLGEVGPTLPQAQEDLMSSGAGSPGMNTAPNTAYQKPSGDRINSMSMVNTMSSIDMVGHYHTTEPRLAQSSNCPCAPSFHDVDHFQQWHNLGTDHHHHNETTSPDLDLSMDYTMSNDWYNEQFSELSHTAFEAGFEDANLDELLNVQPYHNVPAPPLTKYSQVPVRSTLLSVPNIDEQEGLGGISSISASRDLAPEDVADLAEINDHSLASDSNNYNNDSTHLDNFGVIYNNTVSRENVSFDDDIHFFHTSNIENFGLHGNKSAQQAIRLPQPGENGIRARRSKVTQKETRLRHIIIHLNSTLQQTRKVLEIEREVAISSNAEKDAMILELEKKLKLMDMSNRRIRTDQPTPQFLGQMQGVVHQDEILDQILHQQVNDRILEEARLQKRKAFAQKAPSEVSWSGTEEEKENCSPHRTRFSSKALVPLRIVPAGTGTHVTRYPPRQPSTDTTFNSIVQQGPAGRESTSTVRSRSSSTSTMGSMRRIMRKVSDGIMRKSQKDDVLPPPIPEVPAPVRRQMSEVHKDLKKRLTSDSGYASMLSARTSAVVEAASLMTSDDGCYFTAAD